ncbi:dipeptide ABC transporter substrate-binding protein [Pseudomonas aeruginosa]|nr:dipeptide ABC transporter substrate-binding protein [Pseudomonas aeruginosa]
MVCTEASPEGFDIVQYTGAVTADASAETVFNRLLAFRPGTTEVIPGLAERWDVSADGLSYTFHLRPGVKFHTTDYFKPTRSLNADDVLWTFQRALDPKHPWHASALRGYAYFDAMGMGELIKSVEKVDELTVRFVLNRPEAPFLRDMAMPFASIYSAEYGDQLLAAGKQGQLNNQPIGTGPFVFKRYAKDAQVRYTANPDYYAGKPPIDNLVFAITLDPNVRMQKVRAGECQVSLYPKPEDVPRLKQDPNLAVDEIDALLTTLHCHQHPAQAARRPARAPGESTSRWTRRPCSTRCSAPARPVRRSSLSPDPARLQPFDPGLAARSRTRQGAAQGSRRGKSQDHPVHSQRHLAYHPPTPPWAAQMLQADLAKAGIQLTIRSLEWGELLKRSKAGEHDLSLLGWAGDNGDPDNFLSPNLSCAAAESGENQGALVRQGLRGADAQGPRGERSGRAGETVRAGPGGIPRTGPMDTAGLPEAVQRPAEHGAGLRDQSVEQQQLRHHLGEAVEEQGPQPRRQRGARSAMRSYPPTCLVSLHDDWGC